MESSLIQLNHYQNNQTSIKLQSPQPTTSDGRPVIQLQNFNRTDSNNRLQLQQPRQQSQLQYSQSPATINLAPESINNGATYHLSAEPNQTTQQPQTLPQLPDSLQTAAQQSQNPYQFKCSLLEYHLHEAVLINKALRSELQEYKEKIAFEKKLRTVLIDRVNSFTEG